MIQKVQGGSGEGILTFHLLKVCLHINCKKGQMEQMFTPFWTNFILESVKVIHYLLAKVVRYAEYSTFINLDLEYISNK